MQASPCRLTRLGGEAIDGRGRGGGSGSTIHETTVECGSHLVYDEPLCALVAGWIDERPVAHGRVSIVRGAAVNLLGGVEREKKKTPRARFMISV